MSNKTGWDIEDKYVPLVQFFAQGMKDHEALMVVYSLKQFIEDIEDNDKLVALIEDLR